jgi:hypothetical protein
MSMTSTSAPRTVTLPLDAPRLQVPSTLPPPRSESSISEPGNAVHE